MFDYQKQAQDLGNRNMEQYRRRMDEIRRTYQTGIDRQQTERLRAIGKGGKVPVTSHFTLQSTIDKDPAKMQAFVTALWRATQWIKKHSPEEVFDAIEPYVGSTSKNANVIEIATLQKVADYDGTIDAAAWARGEKVWFREMTGIKPLAMADVVTTSFIEAARKAYPA